MPAREGKKMYVEVDQIDSKWKCFEFITMSKQHFPPHRETRVTKVKKRFTRRGKFRTSFSLYLREGGGGVGGGYILLWKRSPRNHPYGCYGRKPNPRLTMIPGSLLRALIYPILTTKNRKTNYHAKIRKTKLFFSLSIFLFTSRCP